MFDIKAIYEAQSPQDAVQLLTDHPEAMVIAGGSDVLVQIREGRHAGKELVSIYGIDALRGIEILEDGTLKIGALSSFTDVDRSDLIAETIPVLADAVRTVGGPQIRNIGTIGGNTCNGVTSADSAATLLAHDAVMEILGPQGVRMVPIKDFYVWAGEVVLEHNEILLSVQIAKENYDGYFGHYYKYAMREAMDIATSTCSVNVKLSEDKKTIQALRMGYGVAGPIPSRVPESEALAKGAPASMETVKKVAANILNELKPRDSWRASKALRQHILVEMTKECMTHAIQKAGGVL